MGLQHGRHVDVLPLLGDRRLDGQQLGIDVGHVHGRQLDRQLANVAGVHAPVVHQAGHLHAGVGGQVVDQPGVEHVAADLVGIAGDNGFHDIGGVLPGTLVGHLAVVQDVFLLLFPALDLVYAAAGILVQGNVELLNELGVLGLDVEGIVLGVVLAGLGAVVAEILDIVEPDHVAVLFPGVFLCGPPADFRIQVAALFVFQFQQPAHVVDAGDELPAALQLVLHVQGLQQVLRADLNTVAQTHGFDVGVTLHVAGEDGHGVGVV